MGGGAGKGRGGGREGDGPVVAQKKPYLGQIGFFCSKKTYLGQIGFCCSEKDRVFEANSKPQTQPEGVGGAGEGRGGGGREGDGPVFAQQKPYRPDRVFLLLKTLSGPDSVFEANSKPRTQPGGVGGYLGQIGLFCSQKPYLGPIGFLMPIPSPKLGWCGGGERGRGRASFCSKKPYLGQIGVFCSKKTISGPDRVFLL